MPGRWYGTYRDHHGKARKTPCYSDKSAALSMALQLEKHGRAVRDGRASADQPAGRAHLIDHVPDYIDSLRVGGNSVEYREEAEASLRRLISQAKLTTPGAVDPVRLDRWLESERLDGRVPKSAKRAIGPRIPLSLRTRNKWVATLKAFGAWLEKSKRSAANPFRLLTMANQDTDPRHIRRALSAEQLDNLLLATAKGFAVRNLTGADRRALYLAAAYSGFRARSLLRLTPESFAVAGAVVLTMTVRAKTTKNKKAHTVPLPPEVGRILGAWLKSKIPGEPVWPISSGTPGSVVRMLRGDLKAAGIPYRDAAGAVFDFHALRGQYATLLVRAGTPAGVVQRLMDHSDPKLTARYTRLVPEDLSIWVDKLPPLGSPLGSEVGGSKRKPPSKVEHRTGSGSVKSAKRPKKSGK